MVRRSTRIKNKAKVEGKFTCQPFECSPANHAISNVVSPPPMATPSRKSRAVVPEIVLAIPIAPPLELNIVPCKSDPIPFEGQSVPYMLDWELQYPPGGSTHPSYPYPSLDPRLIFHQPFVPVIDGLPDITRMPKFVLPIGWRHVSWSGLLPIAFDPYHQAFKLTPVGPMALTCEEVHQGGLNKYIPGGELHPETAMLPQLMNLSDGSADDVYNWDGVDWVLPWPQTENSAVLLGSPVKQYSTIFGNSFSETLIVMYPWRESRDCPDQVLDLEDAWRWVTGKEEDPDADFVPLSSKRLRGAGALRTYRKYKSPMPELMMGAMLAEPNNPNPILQNQDTPQSGKNSRNEFCPFRSVSTPMHVDITLLEDTEFTLVELLCYFPQHFNWGHAAARLTHAGMMPSMIRNMINMTRGLEGDSAVKTGSISSAATTARKREVTVTGATEGANNMGATPHSDSTRVTTNYTAEGWVYDVWSKIDYPLLALAHGLQKLPQGPDAGPLTALIQWCRDKAHYRVLLSDVPALLKEASIEPLIEPSEKGCPDKEVVARHAEAMKQDFKRVKISLEVSSKRAIEEGEESGKKKKRKIEQAIE